MITGAGLFCTCAVHPRAPHEPALPDSTQKTYNSRAIEHFMAGEQYSMQGDHAMAILEYQDALRYDSSSATIYGAMAKAYINLGKLERGIEALQRALRLDPEDYELREILAQVYYLSGNNKAAEKEYEKLIAAKRDDLELHYQLAAIYLRNKKPEKAMEVYDDIFNRDKSQIKALEKAAEIAFVLQKLEQAAKYYDTLIVQQPENINYYKYRSDIALIKNDLPKALEMYQVLSEMAPADIEIAERYGDLLARSDSTRKAHDYLRGLIRNYPDRQAAYISLSMLFARNDEIDSLLSITDIAMEKFPDQSYFPIVRANVLSNQGENDEAVRYLQRVLAIEPDNLQAQLLLANTWEALEQYRLSDSLYSRIISQHPDEAVALNNYAYSLALRGERIGEALQMVEQALAIEPDNASYLDTKGWLLYLQENYKDARKYIEKALSMNSHNAEVLEHMGDVLMKLNKPEEAQKYYRQALEIDNENERLRKKVSQ